MNSSAFRCVVVALTLVLAQAEVMPADKNPDPVVKAPKVIDPHGRPKDFVQGKHRMYGIWYEDGVWKLRTTSGRGVKIDYLGIVDIDKDKIIPDYTALEDTKRRRDTDLVYLSKNRRQMKFKFVTIGWTDGIDFKVGPKTKTVTFNLRVAGDDDPKFILIGAKGVNPAKAKFTLPAHPPKVEPTEKEVPLKK
jgi:hypothetical protein